MELENTTSYLASAAFSGDNTLDVVSKMDAQLLVAPTMGLVLSEWYEKTLPTKFTTCLPANLELIGAEVGHLVYEDWETMLSDKSDFSMWLGHFPEAEVRSFLVSEADALDLRHPAWNGALEEGWKVFILLPVGAGARNIQQVVNNLQRAHADAAIVGGIVTGDRVFQMTNGKFQVSSDGVAGLMFRGNVPLSVLVSRGVAPLSEPYTIGAARSLEAISKAITSEGEVNWDVMEREAAEEMQGMNLWEEDEDELYECVSELITADGESHDAFSALGQAMACSGNGVLIGTSVDPEKDGYNLTCLSHEMVSGQAPRLGGFFLPRPGPGLRWDASCGGTGGKVRFFELSPQQCKEDVISKLTAVAQKAAASGQKLVGGFMFSCAGRGAQFFGEEDFDAKAFGKIFDGKPLMGMYAAGEIGPKALGEAPASRATQVGHAAVQGFTAVYALFLAPERSRRKSCIDIRPEEDIATTYARFKTPHRMDTST